jgi:hypothetical protein
MNDGQGTKLKSGLQTLGRPRAPIRHQPHSPGQTRQFKIQGRPSVGWLGVLSTGVGGAISIMAQCLGVAMKLEWNLDLGIKTLDAQRRGRGWVIHAVGDARRCGWRPWRLWLENGKSIRGGSGTCKLINHHLPRF